MFVRLLAASVLVLVCACAGSSAQRSPDAPPLSRRFVALVPSLAEDFFAIGAGPRVVGVSQFTDVAPPEVPRVADFQSVDTEKIVALHPDAVAAIPSQQRMLAPLARAGIKVLIVRDDTFDDIFTGIRRLGALAGLDERARAEIARLRAETARLHGSTATFRKRPRVFIVLGTAPIWTVGRRSYLGQLVSLAGGVDAARLTQPWGQYSEEALVRDDPDAIIADTDAHVDGALAQEPWRSLRAVRERHVFVISDRRIINALERPGPGYNEGLRWLIERLTPLAK